MKKIKHWLSTRFRYSLHNIVGHPASEIAWILGAEKLSGWIHDKTLPVDLSRKSVQSNPE